MKFLASSLLATAVLGITLTTAQADTLVIPLGHQATDSFIEMPQRGQAKSTVAQRYGEPATRHAPVGHPPITRWDYSEFSVYFEYDRVIDSVRHRRAVGTLAP